MIWKMYIELSCRNFPTIWKEQMVWISFKQIDTKCGLKQIVGKFRRFKSQGLKQIVGKFLLFEEWQ